ncbi:hypothetical protein HK100_010966 [Physocladia obscura]|uniref:HTH La-type RNA-binding domain-containing protein n=1 Tax=Physocladia obscura TaxID=109957 RepID=A0AAD5XGY0_9FUNG|nr:hypothetical protein HK100_010966 [Physocladia obscura]
MEEQIVALLSAFFSEANLTVDIYLAALVRSNECTVLNCFILGIPISLFESSIRLGKLAFDEVIVAKVVRQKIPILEVSEDGKCIRLASKSNSNYSENDQRMFYIEHLPQNASVSSLIARVKNVEKIHLPLTTIIHQFSLLSKKSFQISSLVSDSSPLLSLLDYNVSPPETAANINIKLPSFVFVSVLDMKSVTSSCDIFNSADTGSQWKKLFLGDYENTVVHIKKQIYTDSNEAINNLDSDEWNYIRVMPMSEWRTKMTEYKNLLVSRRVELEQAMASRSGMHDSASYESGVVVSYTGVHEATSRKNLKGYARFKNAKDASMAAFYFSKQNIVQIHANDIGTLITSTEQLMKLKASFKKQNQKSSYIDIDDDNGWNDWRVNEDDENKSKDATEYQTYGIRLVVLQGQEESDYWDAIYEKQEEVCYSASMNSRKYEQGSTVPHYEKKYEKQLDFPSSSKKLSAHPSRSRLDMSSNQTTNSKAIHHQQSSSFSSISAEKKIHVRFDISSVNQNDPVPKKSEFNSKPTNAKSAKQRKLNESIEKVDTPRNSNLAAAVTNVSGTKSDNSDEISDDDGVINSTTDGVKKRKRKNRRRGKGGGGGTNTKKELEI